MVSERMVSEVVVSVRKHGVRERCRCQERNVVLRRLSDMLV